MKALLKRIFLDTEFTGLTQNTSLISIALVAETGEEFYAEFIDYDQKQVTAWINENVVSQLFLNESNQSYSLDRLHILGTQSEILKQLKIWLNQFGELDSKNPLIQIWAD